MGITAYHSLPNSHHAKQISKPACSACFFNPEYKALSSSSSSLPFKCSNNILRGLGVVRIKAKQQRSFGPIHASKAETPPTDVSQKWLLEPVGDGDTRHIGFKVPMPNAYEISSNEVTVGRLPEKADLVIPVATAHVQAKFISRVSYDCDTNEIIFRTPDHQVSGVHARIQKKEENLLVTDLGSTNGTFIDDKKLRPGVVSAAPPGSYLTFGDEHLAVFRISKLENAETASTPDPSEDTVETESPTESAKTS